MNDCFAWNLEGALKVNDRKNCGRTWGPARVTMAEMERRDGLEIYFTGTIQRTQWQVGCGR